MDKLVEDTAEASAIAFAVSMRGQLILSQALVIAIRHLEELEAAKDIRAEPSNCADMRYLLDNVYPMYQAIDAITNEKRAEMVKQAREAIEKTGVKL